MPYLGASPTVGLVTKLSDISASFNGVTTTFQLTVPPGGSSNNFTPGSVYALFVRLGGVTQNPDVDYTVSGSQITFTTAPATGLTCFIIAIGQAINIGTPADGSVSQSKLGTLTSLPLTGATSGTTTLTAPAIAGNNTLVLPPNNGTARQTLLTDGAGNLSFTNDAGALYYRLNTDLAGANVNTAQLVFGVGVTLAAGTVYQFDALYAFNKTAGTTSNTFGLSFGGTATVNNINYVSEIVISGASTGGASNNAFYGSIAQTAANVNTNATIVVASIAASFLIRGTVSINAGGTFIPQYTLSAAPGGAYSTVAGSYIRFVPIGAAGSNSSQGTWS